MEPDLRFLVSSGGVAYGNSDNIASGASVPLMTATADEGFNVRARNGEWHCFGLRGLHRSLGCCEGTYVNAW